MDFTLKTDSATSAAKPVTNAQALTHARAVPTAITWRMPNAMPVSLPLTTAWHAVTRSVQSVHLASTCQEESVHLAIQHCLIVPFVRKTDSSATGATKATT